MIWNLRLDANTKALWEAQAELDEVSLSEFVRCVVSASCSVPAAHRAVAKAIEKGILVRPSICEECRTDCKPHGAHRDYRYPLDVRWLCPKCHRRWDVADPKMSTATDSIYLFKAPDAEMAAWRAEADRLDCTFADWLREAADQRVRGDEAPRPVADTAGGGEIGRELRSLPVPLIGARRLSSHRADPKDKASQEHGKRERAPASGMCEHRIPKDSYCKACG